jgi:site-specific DNA-methyltransferase (adenine-specific)
MELMKRYPDNYFDLSIVDPPYGIDIAKNGKLKSNSKFDRGFKKDIDYGAKNWDSEIPSEEYFLELRRVSKNQIIWGGNYFISFLDNTPCYVTWYKKGTDKNHRFSPTELAWTSFDKKPFFIDLPWIGFGYLNNPLKEKKIHPCHKPINLYQEILNNFAKEGDKILDTHLGGGSIAIACHNLDFELTACELDKKYFDASIKRIQNHVSQQRLF